MCESGYAVLVGPAEPLNDGGLNEWVPFLRRAAVFGSMAAALCGFEGSGASSSSAANCVSFIFAVQEMLSPLAAG